MKGKKLEGEDKKEVKGKRAKVDSTAATATGLLVVVFSPECVHQHPTQCELHFLLLLSIY